MPDDRRLVIAFTFPDAEPEIRNWWLVVEHHAVDLCFHAPGFEVDIWVTSPLRTMVCAWMGDMSLADAVRCAGLEIEGPSEFCSRFPEWLGQHILASAPRP